MQHVDDPDALERLSWYAQRRPVFTGGNAVALMRGGETLFPALREAIDAARHQVWVACYLVSPWARAGRCWPL